HWRRAAADCLLSRSVPSAPNSKVQACKLSRGLKPPKLCRHIFPLQPLLQSQTLSPHQDRAGRSRTRGEKQILSAAISLAGRRFVLLRNEPICNTSLYRRRLLKCVSLIFHLFTVRPLASTGCSI